MKFLFCITVLMSVSALAGNSRIRNKSCEKLDKVGDRLISVKYDVDMGESCDSYSPGRLECREVASNALIEDQMCFSYAAEDVDITTTRGAEIVRIKRLVLQDRSECRWKANPIPQNKIVCSNALISNGVVKAQVRENKKDSATCSKGESAKFFNPDFGNIVREIAGKYDANSVDEKAGLAITEWLDPKDLKIPGGTPRERREREREREREEFMFRDRIN